MLKLGLKIVALPLWLFLSILVLLLQGVTKLYSYGAAIIIDFIVILLILTAIAKQWLNVGGLAGILGAVIIMTLCVGVVSGTIMIWKDTVREFIVS